MDSTSGVQRQGAVEHWLACAAAGEQRALAAPRPHLPAASEPGRSLALPAAPTLAAWTSMLLHTLGGGAPRRARGAPLGPASGVP